MTDLGLVVLSSLFSLQMAVIFAGVILGAVLFSRGLNLFLSARHDIGSSERLWGFLMMAAGLVICAATPFVARFSVT